MFFFTFSYVRMLHNYFLSSDLFETIKPPLSWQEENNKASLYIYLLYLFVFT